MTQVEVAQQLGVSSQMVKNWESSSSYPRMQRLPEIAQLFGRSVAWFFVSERDSTSELYGTVATSQIKQLAEIEGALHKLRVSLSEQWSDFLFEDREKDRRWASEILGELYFELDADTAEKLVEKLRVARELGSLENSPEL